MLISTKPFIDLTGKLFLVGVLRCEQRCPCLQRLGTSTKRADFLKEQSMEGSRLFKDVRSVRVLLVAVDPSSEDRHDRFLQVWVSTR